MFCFQVHEKYYKNEIIFWAVKQASVKKNTEIIQYMYFDHNGSEIKIINRYTENCQMFRNKSRYSEIIHVLMCH